MKAGDHSSALTMNTMTRKIVSCALCAAILCVLAPLTIPIGPVPISLATFAVLFSAFFLGGKWGTAAVGIYLLLGAVGVPVFAGFTGGFEKIIGPTGGYLVGYLPLTLISGGLFSLLGKGRSGWKRFAWMMLASLLGTVVLYALGTAWFCHVMKRTVWEALALCVIPFLPGDLAKAAAAAVLAPIVSKAVDRAEGHRGGAA